MIDLQISIIAAVGGTLFIAAVVAGWRTWRRRRAAAELGREFVEQHPLALTYTETHRALQGQHDQRPGNPRWPITSLTAAVSAALLAVAGVLSAAHVLGSQHNPGGQDAANDGRKITATTSPSTLIREDPRSAPPKQPPRMHDTASTMPAESSSPAVPSMDPPPSASSVETDPSATNQEPTTTPTSESPAEDTDREENGDETTPPDEDTEPEHDETTGPGEDDPARRQGRGPVANLLGTLLGALP